jgi:hypothetical protein
MSPIADTFEKVADWILAVPESVPILFGADPHNAALVRALSALTLIVFVVFVIARRPFSSIFCYLKKITREPDKRN